ncbi:19059_t:CDS:1, partial [Racocetra persica]
CFQINDIIDINKLPFGTILIKHDSNPPHSKPTEGIEYSIPS